MTNDLDYKEDNMWLMNGDCLERMKEIPDGSVDMILTDPPYGTVKGLNSDGYKGSRTEWDNVIPIEKFTFECQRIVKNYRNVVIFSQEPFTSKMVSQKYHRLEFAYKAFWEKNHFGNPLIAKKSMVNMVEEILIFSKRYEDSNNHPLKGWFIDQLKLTGESKKYFVELLNADNAIHFFSNGQIFRLPNEQQLVKMKNDTSLFQIEYDEMRRIHEEYLENKRLSNKPVFNIWQGGKVKRNLLKYDKDRENLHPTQKPVALLEDLIKTYTNEGDTVLDFTMGSGSTGVAANNLNRSFIGIEMDEDYYSIALSRILSGN